MNKKQRILDHQGASNINCSTVFVTVLYFFMFAAFHNQSFSTMAGLIVKQKTIWFFLIFCHGIKWIIWPNNLCDYSKKQRDTGLFTWTGALSCRFHCFRLFRGYCTGKSKKGGLKQPQRQRQWKKASVKRWIRAISNFTSMILFHLIVKC